MKNLNILIIKYLQSIVFIYKIKNTIFLKKYRNIIRKLLNNTFIIYIIFKKKDINILQKHIIFNIKVLIYKSLFLSVKKIF